jgi:hypothetical protein
LIQRSPGMLEAPSGDSAPSRWVRRKILLIHSVASERSVLAIVQLAYYTTTPFPLFERKVFRTGMLRRSLEDSLPLTSLPVGAGRSSAPTERRGSVQDGRGRRSPVGAMVRAVGWQRAGRSSAPTERRGSAQNAPALRSPCRRGRPLAVPYGTGPSGGDQATGEPPARPCCDVPRGAHTCRALRLPSHHVRCRVEGMAHTLQAQYGGAAGQGREKRPDFDIMLASCLDAVQFI